MSKKYFFTMIIILVLSLFSGVLLLEFSTPTDTNIANSPNEDITDAASISMELSVIAVGTSSWLFTFFNYTLNTYWTEKSGVTQVPEDIKVSGFTATAGNTKRTIKFSVSDPFDDDLTLDYIMRCATATEFIQWTGTKYYGTGTTHTFSTDTSSYRDDYDFGTFIIVYKPTLTLEANGGSGGPISVESSISKMNTKVISSFPTRTGYTFNGYYNGDVEVIDKNGYLVTLSYPTTHYAKWTANTYTISYHGNSNTGGSTASSSHTYDTAKALTSNGFTKTGYRFIGWSTSENGSVVYSDGQNVKNLTATNGGTVNLYAQWERYEYKIDINFYKLDGTTQQGGTFDLYKKLPGGSETLVKSGISNEVTGQELLQYEGQFILKNFKAIENGAYVNLKMNNVSLSTPTGAGTIEIVNNTIVYTANQTGPPSGDGDWDNAILIYTSTNNVLANFNYNGGTVVRESDSQYYSSNGTYLLKIPTKKEMSRTGYTFIGWNTADDGSGKYYTSETNFNVINNNLDDKTGVLSSHCVATANAGNIEFTLYAIWEANDYKINYELNGGSHDSSAPTTATYDVVINISNPTKKGYTFTGWTASGLSNTAQAGGASWNGTATTATAFKNLTAKDAEDGGTVTLTANWTANTYTINYNLGDDDTYPANLDSNAPKSATYNVAIKIPTPTRVGYVFVGWTLSGDDISDDISTDISTAQSGASDTSLSAWDGGANRNRYFKNLTPDASGSVTMTATWQATIASDIESTYSTAGTYYINTAADLAKLIYTTENKAVGNGYIFIQTANIDLSGLTYLPIGRLNSFSGTYDGQGYTISGLRTYNGTDANGDYLETNGGLFANAGGATITNVIIEDATIYGQNAGIIAGSGNAKSISNCIVSGSVNGKTASGSIIGNGNGANISVCLAKEVNTSSFAGGSASVDSCIYELTGGTKGASGSFNNYSAWIYPSNFAYPMPKAFMWYPYPELTKESLNTWLGK